MQHSHTVCRKETQQDTYCTCKCYHCRDHPHYVKANKERTRERHHFRKLSNLESQVCDISFQSFFLKFSLSSPVHCKASPSSLTLLHLSIYSMFLDPYTPFCLLSLLLSLSLFPCLPQPSTMAIMTHLPVKLLPVETASPWHGTQCLSASLLKSFKSQVDIILPATGITPSYNASIFSRRLELRAAKQWDKADQAKICELRRGISTGQRWIYFWPE